MVNVILNCFHKKHCMFHKHGKNMSIKNHAENILVSEKELSYINFKRLKTTYLILIIIYI